MLTQEYIFSSTRPTPSEITEHDSLIRDVLAGAVRMKNNATQYVRKPDGMDNARWAQYLRGAHFSNIALATLHTWLGLADRKPHQIETDGLTIPFRLGHLMLDEQHLVAHAIANVFSLGRVAYFADPANGIVSYGPSDEVEIVYDSGKLTKVVFQEEDDKRLDLAMVDDIAQYQWSNNEGVGDGYRALLVNGKPLDYLPVVFINAMDLDRHRSLSPLFEIACLSIKAWDLALSQAHALWYTANPQPCVFGVSNETEIPKSMGPATVWTFSNPDAKAQLLTYQGDGLTDRAKEMLRLDMQMAALGANVVLSKGNSAHTVAKTAELRSRESAADLVFVLENISDGLTIILRHWAELNGKSPNKVFVKCNCDLVDQTMGADMIRALNEARRDGLLSFTTMINILKAGEILPANLDPEDERERVNSDDTTILGEDQALEKIDAV